MEKKRVDKAAELVVKWGHYHAFCEMTGFEVNEKRDAMIRHAALSAFAEALEEEVGGRSEFIHNLRVTGKL